MTFRDLLLRLRALVAPRRVDDELDEELTFHIGRETQRQIASGVGAVEARRRALARFGPVSLAADQCRDARGTALLDALARDIVYAVRTFQRAPLAAVTIVATVALGLGLITAVFLLYNTLFLRADAVRRPGELFAVERPSRPGADSSVPFKWSEFEALRRDTSVFTDSFAMMRPGRTRIDGRPLLPALVTGNFFQVLGVQPVLGRALTPEDDGRSPGRPAMVLSHRAWNRLFAEDPTVINRTVSIDEQPYQIVGVMPEEFRGLGIGPPDYWAPLELAGQVRRAPDGKEEEIEIAIVGRLKPGLSPEAASLLVICTACALAVSVPALRAARIDPIATLRKE